MLGFKSFRAAANVLAGIELIHMIRKGQMAMPGCESLSLADQFYALAGQIRPAWFKKCRFSVTQAQEFRPRNGPNLI
jgi:hypothetical protein